MSRVKIILIGVVIFGVSVFAGHRLFLSYFPYSRTREILGLITRGTFEKDRWIYIPANRGRIRVVRRTSPDVLFAYCLFDLSQRNLEVSMEAWGQYQSASVFSDESDHYLSVKSLNGDPLRFTITKKDIPFEKGFIIMRRLYNGKKDHRLADQCRSI